MEEKERFEEIKERLSFLLENQISHFRYTLYSFIQVFPLFTQPFNALQMFMSLSAQEFSVASFPCSSIFDLFLSLPFSRLI